MVSLVPVIQLIIFTKLWFLLSQIREGECCNLYFDIEFLKAQNPQLAEHNQQDEMMKAFVRLVSLELQIFFLLPFRVKRRHFVDLDSSDNRKFSRHLVIRLPDNYAFINNVHCGNFVKMLHRKLVLLRELFTREHTNLKEAGEEEEEHDPFIPEDKMHSQHSLTTRDVLNQLFVRNGILYFSLLSYFKSSHSCLTR